MTFAKRHTPQPPLQFDVLPDKLRRQIVKILQQQRWDTYSISRQIFEFLDYEYDWQVAKANADSTAYEDLIQAILEDKDTLKVLTIVEYFFVALLQLGLGVPEYKLRSCQDLNRFFLENGVG